MKIKERFIKGKRDNPELCEDGIFCNEDFVAVFDGVTAKTNRKFNGKSGGRAAMECAINTLSQAKPDIDAESLFEKMNSAITELYEGTATGEAAVCAMVYSRHYKEIWSVGDCQCLVNDKFFKNEKQIDIILSNARSLALEIYDKIGVSSTEDVGRAFIMPLLKEQYRLANSNSIFSYSVLNGTPEFDPKSYLCIEVSEGAEIVLATDGYPKLFNTLEESEKVLSYLIENDPECRYEYYSTKGIQEGCCSFDDRAYIRVNI